MELEQKNPLQLLVQSVTKQQQTKSDLTGRLAHLVLMLAKHNREIASLVDEEKSLRLQLAEKARGNLHLEEMNATMLQSCDAEHQTRSSLALTLDSLNEKKLSLEEAVITKKQLYDDDLSKQRSLLEIEGKALADLIDGEGTYNLFIMQSSTSADNILLMKIFRGPKVLYDSFAARLILHSVSSVPGHHSVSSKHAAPRDVEHYVPKMIEEVKFLHFDEAKELDKIALLTLLHLKHRHRSPK